jgi:hypothetical protein
MVMWKRLEGTKWPHGIDKLSYIAFNIAFRKGIIK